MQQCGWPTTSLWTCDAQASSLHLFRNTRLTTQKRALQRLVSGPIQSNSNCHRRQSPKSRQALRHTPSPSPAATLANGVFSSSRSTRPRLLVVLLRSLAPMRGCYVLVHSTAHRGDPCISHHHKPQVSTRWRPSFSASALLLCTVLFPSPPTSGASVYLLCVKDCLTTRVVPPSSCSCPVHAQGSLRCFIWLSLTGQQFATAEHHPQLGKRTGSDVELAHPSPKRLGAQCQPSPRSILSSLCSCCDAVIEPRPRGWLACHLCRAKNAVSTAKVTALSESGHARLGVAVRPFLLGHVMPTK